MKTAEEWVKLYNENRLTNPRDENLVFHTGAIIKQIQSDARAQGMTDAAEMMHKQMSLIVPSAAYQAILDARDKTTL